MFYFPYQVEDAVQEAIKKRGAKSNEIVKMKADRAKFEKEQQLQEKQLDTVVKDEADAMEMYTVSCYISSLKMSNKLM